MSMYTLTFKVASFLFNISYTFYIKTLSYLKITFPELKLKKTKLINNKLYKEYYVLIDDKYHNVIFVDTLPKDIDEKKKYIVNSVLNCSICYDKKTIDYTKEFQAFYHNMSSSSMRIYWKTFFDYLLLKECIINSGYIQIMLNDSNLTLYNSKISEISDCYFYLNDNDSIKKMIS
jgi:hypothetical protein